MVVRRHNNGRAGAIDFVEQRHDALARCRIEVARWFVGQHDERTIDEGSRDRHALLLATRQLVREAIFLARQAHEVQHERHLAGNHVSRLADDLEGKGHVFKDGLVGQQLVVLKHVAHAAAQEGHTRVGNFVDVATGNPHLAALGTLLAIDQAQDRGLARPRWAHEKDEVTLGDVERHIAHGNGLPAIPFGDIFQTDH